MYSFESATVNVRVTLVVDDFHVMVDSMDQRLESASHFNEDAEGQLQSEDMDELEAELAALEAADDEIGEPAGEE